MSRIGRKALPLPKGVTVTPQGRQVAVKGPKGELTKPLPRAITFKIEKDKLPVAARRRLAPEPRQARPRARAPGQHGQGRHRRLERELEINGVGYRAEVAGDTHDHGARLLAPGACSSCRRASPPRSTRTVTILTGADRDMLGQTAAKIRELRPPEPYKGKGVKYVEEVIKRKVGKAGADGFGRRRLGEVQAEAKAHRPPRKTARRESRKKRHRCPSASGSRGTAERPRLAVFRSRGTSTPRSSTTSPHDDAGADVDLKDRARPSAGGKKATSGKKVGAAIAKQLPRKGRSTRSSSTAPVTCTTAASRRSPTAPAKPA